MKCLLLVLSIFLGTNVNAQQFDSKIMNYKKLLTGKWYNVEEKNKLFIFTTSTYAETYSGVKVPIYQSYSIKLSKELTIPFYILILRGHTSLETITYTIKKIDSANLQLFSPTVKNKVIVYKKFVK